ncbi:MAG: PQQ-binding-like beta-propeller repeat protein [Anaerolineae bacterium]|nr:PQQ-binding-like beta-propeller repeat protein [Anaerolineae bacterium]MDW8100396.1 PQQ-binding-like beta-propeller repeat protein [Anaerolineae bacterium]
MRRKLVRLAWLLLLSAWWGGCQVSPNATPTALPPSPTARLIISTPALTYTPIATPAPTFTPRTEATFPASAVDVGWTDTMGGPGRARFNPAAQPGLAMPLWRLSFQRWQQSEVRPVAVAASPQAIFTVDSTGRLLRIKLATGQIEAEALIWPYGPRGIVQGAWLAVTDDVVAVAASDAYSLPQARLPYFRVKLALFDAGSLARLWELPGQVGRDYQILAQHGQIAVTTDGSSVAMYQARTGKLVWHRAMAGQQYRLLAASDKLLFLRNVSLSPPEARGPYEQRQAFLALNWRTGEVQWEVRPALEDDVIEAMADDQRLYLLAYQGRLLALDATDGSELWRIHEGPTLYERASVALAHGRLYGVRLPERVIAAYDVSSGQTVWQISLGDTESALALAVAESRLYLAQEQTDSIRVRAFDADTGQLVMQRDLERSPSLSAAVYPELAVAADRLILASAELSILGEGPAPGELSPVPPPIFPPITLPADEVLYESTETGNGDIWARPANPAAGAPRNLTAHGADDWDPAGSPDGSRVAFESYRSGSSNLWVIHRDGSAPTEITQMTRTDAYNVHPTWSPNSEFVAFASDRDGDMQIWLARANGGDARKLTTEGRNWDPAWSPDGSLIAFISDRSGNADIWVMAPDGSHQWPWRETPEPEADPAWSPGCAEDLNGPNCALAFVRATNEQPEWGELRAGLFNGSLEWSIPGTFWGYDRGPSWWPGCTALGSNCWLAWGRRTEDKPQLMLGDLDGNQIQPLGEGKDPSWLMKSKK